ncbi:MAG: bifunctional UDP-N-acetylglucosamine diphosphorylase/glucosamine-1-phosphate N-acetyltransferase GlmU [Chromatiaceae bacterium]
MKLGIAILAAGQGTRMKSNMPKVLHTLAGRPLLRHVLDTAQELDAARLCVVQGHGGEQVRQALAGMDCEWVSQIERLGTGHALIQAMPRLADMDRVLVLYGDIPLIRAETLRKLLATAANAPLAILTATLANPSGYGRMVRGHDGQVEGIVEEKDASKAELDIDEINTGFLVADRASLDNWLSRLDNNNAQGEYYLTDIVALAAAEGRSIATCQAESEEEILGVNDRIQLADLERRYQHRIAKDLMRSGVTLLDPTRFDVRGKLKVGLDVTIDINCLFEGEVELGDGVSIGPNCQLKNCAIGANSRVLANSVIEEARTGKDTQIGPFARLRPQADIADGAHIGNFVEIKKALIGPGTKVSHLTYIGDAHIGGNVNIGAGTITCNYDGVNKHLTQIGDGAFIGSNTALVAPVTVGAGATIGAGSVIGRNAPAAKLTLTRSPQRTIDHWIRPVKNLK